MSSRMSAAGRGRDKVVCIDRKETPEMRIGLS